MLGDKCNYIWLHKEVLEAFQDDTIKNRLSWFLTMFAWNIESVPAKCFSKWEWFWNDSQKEQMLKMWCQELGIQADFSGRLTYTWVGQNCPYGPCLGDIAFWLQQGVLHGATLEDLRYKCGGPRGYWDSAAQLPQMTALPVVLAAGLFPSPIQASGY